MIGEYNNLSSQYNMLSIPKKDNFIQKLFKKITGQYKKLQSDIDNAYNKMNEIQERVNEKKHLLNDIKKDKEKAENDLKELNDPENYSKKNIQKLIDENPDLRKDSEFMTALVMKYPQAIVLDKSDNKRVYNQFFRQYIQKLENVAQDSLYAGTIPDKAQYNEVLEAIQLVERIVEEINTPKEPEKGKYKIPQKFLFENIRNATLTSDKIYPQRMFIKNSYGTGSINSYLDLDCSLPQEYGIQMENLINDDNVYILRHKMYNLGENQDIINEIMKDGLHDSNQGGRNRMINNTFSTNIPGGHPLNLLGLLEYSDSQIIYAIPKEVLDNENSLIWKSNEDDGVKYLDPQYLVGYVKKGEPQLHLNPIPISERTKYSKGFSDRMIIDDSEVNNLRYMDIEDKR